MLIKCPKCRSVYDLPDDKINDDGLTVRCAECSEIWTAFPRDALKFNNPPAIDIKKMFQRVSKETDALFAGKETPAVEKIKIVNVTKEKHGINFALFLLFILSLAGMLYYMRYDIVRMYPQAEEFYDRLSIGAIPYGRNLEFRDIATREYSEENIAKLEITGAIANTGKFITGIPPIKVDVFDRSGKLLISKIHRLPLPRLVPGYDLLFKIELTNPTPFGKSIYLTFADN